SVGNNPWTGSPDTEGSLGSRRSAVCRSAPTPERLFHFPPAGRCSCRTAPTSTDSPPRPVDNWVLRDARSLTAGGCPGLLAGPVPLLSFGRRPPGPSGVPHE